MDEFTKRKVRRAISDNPELPVRFIIGVIRAKQSDKWQSKQKTPKPCGKGAI